MYVYLILLDPFSLREALQGLYIAGGALYAILFPSLSVWQLSHWKPASQGVHEPVHILTLAVASVLRQTLNEPSVRVSAWTLFVHMPVGSLLFEHSFVSWWACGP